MEEDEDDPVVHEMPVYLSHALQNLYVFQYPTQPAENSHEHEQVLKCCFKPDSQELEMEIAMDTSSTNYDTSHGEQIAVNVDGGKNVNPNERFFQSSMMDKRFLKSSRVDTDMDSVAIATIKDNQFILSPIQGMLSIHPTFPHLDMTDKRAKEEAKEMGEDVSGGEEEEGEKQVTVKFARQESERVKKAREKSYHYLSKRSAEEKWYHTEYHKPSSRRAEVERAKLTTVDLEDQMGSMCLTSTQYMDNLLPVQQDPAWSLPYHSSHMTSLTQLSHLPIPEIVSGILKQVNIITFRQLSEMIVGHGDPVKLLRSVQQVAVLVQGNWVIRSEFVYPHNSFSDVNGVPGDRMCRVRDYILYLLAQGETIERQKLAAIVKLPPEELKQLLTQVARLGSLKRWELRLPPDTDFIESNPEVVERQSRAWSSKYTQLLEAFSETSNTNVTKGKPRRRESSISGLSDQEGSGQTRASRHKKDSFSSDQESGAEASKPKKLNRNSESFDKRQIKTENVETQSQSTQKRKKRYSESSSDVKVNGTLSKTKVEMDLPENCL